MVFGIALATTAGLAGAIFYVAHHIAIQTTLFLVAGLVERTGDSTAVDRLGGLAKASPLLAVLFFVPAMNLAGVPPFSGFIGKLGLLEAGVAAGGSLPHLLVVAGVVTSLLTLVAISRVWSRAFWRPPTQSPARDEATPARAAAPSTAWERHTAVATATEAVLEGTREDGERPRGLRPLPGVMVAATAGMVTVTVALTVLAGPLYGVAEGAARDLLDRGPYVEAVFGGGENVP
jgi:multicomponent Na+:H+ antiporter subunit D